MKIQVERDVLAEAVAWAARALPVRPPVPELCTAGRPAGVHRSVNSGVRSPDAAVHSIVPSL